MTLLTHPMKRNAGKKMLVCVAIFGAATVVFGLSRNIWLSCAALLVVGASDMISRGGAVEHFAAGDAERDAWKGVERELAVSGREQRAR